MKIAWIVYGSLLERTGGTIYDALVVDGLRGAGDDVHVLDARVHDGPSLVRALARLGPDTVVGDELCHRELAEVFVHRSGARRVLLVHHLTCWEEELPARGRACARVSEAQALRRADRILATSASTRARLMLEGMGRKRAIDVVRPGADRLRSLPRTVTTHDGPIELLFVGAIIARKRVLELVGAMSVAEDARLTLVGKRTFNPMYVARVESGIAVRKLAERVHFAGELSEVNLAERLSAADAFVLPSSLEGYGIAATEAIHAGVPVLAARTPGLVEALDACTDACLFLDDEEPRPIDAAILRIVRERALLARMQEAACVARASLPTWEGCASAFRAAITRP